jgi:hypothetical protein
MRPHERNGALDAVQFLLKVTVRVSVQCPIGTQGGSVQASTGPVDVTHGSPAAHESICELQ